MKYDCRASLRRCSAPAALLAVVLSGCLRGVPVGATPPDTSVRLIEVECYVVCDSLTAHFRPNGMVIRVERGAIIGGARERIQRNGADTVSADPAGLDSLRAGLTDLLVRGLAVEYRQGDPPCIPVMTTHTPVVTIGWSEGDGPRRVRYDFGCHEPSGRVEAVMLLALRVARFGERPVTPR